MFEHRHQPLLHKRAFVRRLILFWIAGLLFVFGSLAIGVIGYR